MASSQQQSPPHFVIVTFPAQGHVNPARHLARLLVRRIKNAHVTFCTPVSFHRKVVIGQSATADGGDHRGSVAVGARISYVPYSDGYDDGFNMEVQDIATYMAQFKTLGAKSVSDVLRRLAGADGPPVTCVIYNIMMSWVADVAREHGIPSALYWIQPATVFLALYHYFRGHEATIAAVAHDPYATVHIPGLPPLRIRDLPSFCSATSGDSLHHVVLVAFRQLFHSLGDEEKSDGRRPTILINSFVELEADAIRGIQSTTTINPVAIGPVLSVSDVDDDHRSKRVLHGDRLQDDDHKAYMGWLDKQPARSVVYVSFGSTSDLSRRQMTEIVRGLKASKFAFFMVVRKENKLKVGEDVVKELALDEREGMVVDWCSQVEVLAHRAVACFVTHFGWNSTLESLVSGVPVVGVPQWSDQGTNAWMMESIGVGVRGLVGEDGVLEAEELQRCLGLATADAARAAAEEWKAKASAAVAEGGSSDGNLLAFVDSVTARPTKT